jgi:flagellin
MASVINTNVASLNAQRNLTMSQSSLATSLQRLSSGLRINSAKDDAAGLAISDRFTTQIRGLNQAVRNANDAISLSQTAEGALAEMTSNLQRIRELAIQSANATNSASDRAALDLEVQQRLAELERISSQTSFNGQKILDGTFGNAAFQVGANVGETITIDLATSMRPSSIGELATVSTNVDLNSIASTEALPATQSSGIFAAADFSTVPPIPTDSTALGAVTVNAVSNTDGQQFRLQIDGLDVINVTQASGSAETIDTARLQAAFDAFDTAQAGYSISGSLSGGDLVVTKADGTDMAITLTNTFNTGGTITGSGSFVATHTGGTPEDTTANETITVDSTAVVLNTNIETIDDLVDVINDALIADNNNDVVASVGLNGELVITTTATGASVSAPTLSAVASSDSETMLGTLPAGVDGRDTATYTIEDDGFIIQLGDSDPVNVAAGDYNSAQEIVDAVNAALAGNAVAELNENGTLSIYSDEDVTISGTNAITDLGLAAFTEADQSLTGGNILTVAATNDIIRRVDSALTSISDLRSTFGAIQNRFESTITNLTTAVENLSASRSRIMDADFAAETANLTRAQILQQAGTAMLAQANAVPQGVLSLLQG